MNLLRRPMSRAPYIFWCLVAAVSLHTIARLGSHQFFRVQIAIDHPFSYLLPLYRLLFFLRWTDKEAPYILFLVALAVPFLALGLILSARRLSDAGLPRWLVWGLLLPGLNLLLFALFCILPASSSLDERPYSDRAERMIDAAWVAAGTGLVGVLLVVLASRLGRYTMALFVTLPFAMGLLAAWIHSRRRQRTARECLAISFLSVLLLGVFLIGVAIEGVICVLMAVPIALPLAMLGGYLGYLTQTAVRRPSSQAASFLVVLLCIPGMMGADYLDPPVAPRIEIVTVFEINAPPEVVWRNLIAFPEIGPPSEWLFRNGVSYPRQARIIGRGVGAFRFCDFSTGTFIERITAWDENRRMDFRVVSQPSTMREMSPYPGLHPPHLDGYLHPEEARFTLTPLPGGRTRLEGRSFYKNEMWPMTYWRVWSDAIIKRVHRRVFGQIKRLSEREAGKFLLSL